VRKCVHRLLDPFQISSATVHCVAVEVKKHIWTNFNILCVIICIGLEANLSAGAQLQIPLSSGIRSVILQKRDGQNLNRNIEIFCPPPSAHEVRAPPYLAQ